jgi:hypothetical protein
VNLRLYETESFCSGIYLKVETTSSIPGEISSISDIIWSNKDQYFKGSVPSTFSFFMTPSIFKTDSSLWETENTGYHISIQEDPVYGSQAFGQEYYICRFKHVYDLIVEVELHKNWSVLYTQRFIVQSTITLLSSLSGSVIGIMGISGFIMNLVENNYLNFKRKRDIRLNPSMFLSRSKRIIMNNFDHLETVRADLNEEGNDHYSININTMSEYSLSTSRIDDPMKYKVEGLDAP